MCIMTFPNTGYPAMDPFMPATVFMMQDTSTVDSTAMAPADSGWVTSDFIPINPERLSLSPVVSLQQALKNEVSGLYVQETTGEPGTVQNMFVRGISMPLISPRETYQTQPLIVLDGIPLVAEHPFAYDIKLFDYNRIGPATNLLANIDMNNIESVQVLKDPVDVASYGPYAVNGVIVLQSKKAQKETRINVDSYIGLAQRPYVTTINGAFENAFRRQFYDRYTATGSYSPDDVYPLYLSDSLNMDYYGPSNWTDSYYRNGLNHSITADIAGGIQLANFRFSAGKLSNQGIADDTRLDRYSAMFNLYMRPLKWLGFTAMINGNRLIRDRNRTLRDRFGEMGYLPELQSPLAPNNSVYSQYLSQFEKGFDNNATNSVQGYANLDFTFSSLTVSSKLSVDYNEGHRDIFYPRSLMDEVNFASNYYGYNQRLIFDNSVRFDWRINERHSLLLRGGGILNWDTYKYNYAYGYRGINDFIKLNLIEADRNNSNFLNPSGFARQLVYKFLDRTRQNLVSFYGKADYSFQNQYFVSLLLRTDGSSNAQPTNRWFFSPGLSFRWDLKNSVFTEATTLSAFNFRLGAARTGRIYAFDNFSQGPQYTSDITYSGNITVPGYNAFAVLSRPYNFGWVGYGIPWAYADRLNAGIDLGLWNDRLNIALDGYIRDDKDQLIGIPSYAEYGYSQSYEHGMNVRNVGLDVTVAASVLKPTDPKKLAWTSAINLSFNQNRLQALPRGIDQLVIGDRLLKVGERIDRYWLLLNEGIYAADEDVPQVNGVRRTFNGITLRAGDPIWHDTNGDEIITDEDRVLTGNAIPKIVGGFDNQFQFENWTLGANFHFQLGRKLLNQQMASRFDFVNREGGTSIDAVKEITYWEKHGDYDQYPLYNPWSTVIPYRVEQDLFLEDGAFLKLRSVTLGYDLSDWFGKRVKSAQRLYLYGSVFNVFTISSFSGGDPELAGYTGYYSGYGMTIPRTFTLGVKLGL